MALPQSAYWWMITNNHYNTNILTDYTCFGSFIIILNIIKSKIKL